MSEPETILDSLLKGVYDVVLDMDEGKLDPDTEGLFDPDAFGIALVDMSGNVFAIGDTDIPFPLQSMSKAFSFDLAMSECGPESVFERVGAEPSGDPYNAIELDSKNRAPNALVNSGAITVTAMLRESWGYKTPDETAERIRELFSDFAGAQLDINQPVFEGMVDTAHHNLAIANLLRSQSRIADAVIDTYAYLQQCAINVTTTQLATMAATIANIGTNPVTGVTVTDPLSTRHTLSVMATCGMYDGSGEWMLNVGVPAKSGVSGGVVAVVNRQLGIGVWSPRLDERGNSVRALRACAMLAEELGLHAFELSNPGSSLLAAYLKND